LPSTETKLTQTKQNNEKEATQNTQKTRESTRKKPNNKLMSRPTIIVRTARRPDMCG